ncbi:MAG TPA: serine/threonine-protein kinase [Acidimicrobiia bacterium]
MRQLGSRYTLDHVIGRGGTGEVWLARDEVDDPVAVKVLRPELVDDQEIVVRFLRERQVLRSVRNSHIVGVRDLVVEGDTLAIVMDYVARSDLRTYLREHGGALAPSVAVSLTRQMLDALAVVHAAGVVHRDVKPENVLIDTDGNDQPVAKLSDFGVSRLLDGVTLTRISGLIGTPRYMAPELGHGADPSPASDLYAVGVVLYEMLAAHPPFTGDHPIAVLRAHAEDEPDRPRGVPVKLWRVLVKLLAKDPALRYQDAQTAADALARVQPILAGIPPLATGPSDTASTYTPGRKTTGGRRWRIPLLTPRRLTTNPTRASKRDAFVAIAAVVSFAAVAMFAVVVSRPAPAAGAELAWLDSYDNFVVRRDWQLTGPKGDVFRATESIMVTSPTPLKMGTRYYQVVPKSIARLDTQVHFYGNKPAVVNPDPVFRVDLAGATRGTFGYVSYGVQVRADGMSKSRLLKWNEELARERAAISKQLTGGTQVEPKSTRPVTPETQLVDPAAVPVPSDVANALKAAAKTADVATLGAPTKIIQIGTPAPPLENVTPAPRSDAPTTVLTDPSPVIPVTEPPTTTTTAPPPVTTDSSTSTTAATTTSSSEVTTTSSSEVTTTSSSDPTSPSSVSASSTPASTASAPDTTPPLVLPTVA